MSKKQRKRLEPTILTPVATDPSAYTNNKGSKNARKIHTEIENIEIDVWFDKHYADRAQFGDENGRREGIDNETVSKLLKQSLKHLIYYSLKVKNFIFINFGGNPRAFRIVLKQNYLKGDPLNIVVEFHHMSFNKLEVTVNTAMCIEDFKMSDGQYCIDFDSNGNSQLVKKEQNKLVNISIYEE